MKHIEYRTFGDMSVCIRQNIHKIKEDIDLVVGIPRSGMVPAFMIALFKNIKACSIDEFINGSEISSGLSRSAKTVKRIRNVLIVDDSVHSGVALTNVKLKLENAGLMKKYNIKFLAIYARDKAVDLVDYYFEIVPTPRMFEWNYLNININERSCFDIDGVLCVDPTKEENDDGKKYREFLLNARPLFIPEYTIHTLVTSRLEKYRPETEEWLRRNGVKYKNLVMLNLKSKEERIKMNAHGSYKARVYLENTDTELFVESEPKQAEQIARLSGKPCICVGNDVLYDFKKPPELNLINLKDYEKEEIKDKKKILLFSHEFTYTGAPHSLHRICKVILKQGHFVEVWGPADGEFRVEFEKLGVKVRIVLYSAMSLQNIKEAVSKFDLALVNTAIPWQAYDAFVDYVPTIWYIREATNLPDICKGVPGREKALKNAKELYCVSEYAAEFISKEYNKNVKVIHNCVEDFSVSKENKVGEKINFVTLGTVTHRKAFDVYLDAFEKLPQKLQEKAHLYFAGRLIPEREAYWKPILEQAEKNPNITYVGEITDIDEKVKFMKKMNIVVVPSRDESCSLVVLEGASMSKPLIVTENVGAKYMVNKDNGYVVATGDVDALCEAYKDIIEHPERIKAMSKASRKSYDEQATIALYEKNIGNMITEHLAVDAEKYRNKIKVKRAIKNAKIVKLCKSLKDDGLKIALKKCALRLHLSNKNFEPKKVSVFGSFVISRAVEQCYLANMSGKFSSLSILSAMCREVKDAKFLPETDFPTRMVNIDCHKTLIEELALKKSDFLIMDLLDERYSIGKMAVGSDEFIVTKVPKLVDNLNNIHKNSKIRTFKFSEEKQKELAEVFCKRLLSIYKGSEIVLVKSKFPTTYINTYGKKCDFSEEKLNMIENNNHRIDTIFKVVAKNLPKCKIVDMTKHCVVEEIKGKEVSPTDFNEEYYRILKKKINTILM